MQVLDLGSLGAKGLFVSCNGIPRNSESLNIFQVVKDEDSKMSIQK